MQSKRTKRSRIRAAKVTSGHGHKKKNRGAGNRGGRGNAGAGKRGDAKLMRVTKGIRTMGKHGFTSIKKLNSDSKSINLETILRSLDTWVAEKKVNLKQDVFEIDLNTLGFDKLLSKGSVNQKLNIRVKSATAQASKKVSEAGGKIENA